MTTSLLFFFFFQAEDGIRDLYVTGVQTCALPISAWPVFRDALSEHRDRIRALLASGCQTNEVGRSAALLGGFLEVAHRSRKPLVILEIGASAGLNLLWDRYRYESSQGAWGDAGSHVRFTHSFEAP